MKNVIRLLAVAALATTFALPAFAQDTAGTGTAAASAQDVEAKAALYKKFLDNYKGTPEQQKTASEAGREYLTKYGSDTSAEGAPIVKFIQNWVSKYEAAAAQFNFTKAVNENPAQAFQLGREMLAKNPDDLKVYLQLVAAGIKSAQSGNKSLNAETLNMARRALQLIEQGKTADVWAPFANQQDAPHGLRYYVGFFSFDTAPEDAAANLLRVAQSNSIFSKEPSTYQLLGAAYYNGEFKKLAAEYKEKYEGKEETPESAALFNRINVVLDRVIDAYARAVALSNGKAQYAQLNSQAKTALTAFYKQRHENSDAGLNELIASVLSRPIPVPGQEPAPTPASSSSSANGANGNGVSTTPANATTQPASGTGTKPAATTAPNPGAKPAAPGQKPPVSKNTPAAKGAAAKTSGR